ncbi:hypothetical protein MCOR25_005721 [Pyricularia grisea]|uniref:Antifungal protein n=1 Tax=Pyricularia grisea TaxID=148305 RepID=A0A6P8AQB2_PYRGI|nr:uncharacterized protein PgNI_12191 [Pyricularia grisea]KAI6363987.1 hypothetical protein MCOR25_005721 [Pyricularia grisea]TLD04255.1 hypothetical protein PgNI_12191 [Pyricularia grisea]
MQFSKIQLFTLLAAVGAMARNVAPVKTNDTTDAAAPVDNIAPSTTISIGLFGSDAKTTEKDAPLERRILIKNCEARTSKPECERIFSGCKWLRGSSYCVDK